MTSHRSPVSCQDTEAWRALCQNESIGPIRAWRISFDRIMQSIVAAMQRSISYCPIRHESSGFGFLVHLLPAACQSTNLLVSSFAAIMFARPLIVTALRRALTARMMRQFLKTGMRSKVTWSRASQHVPEINPRKEGDSRKITWSRKVWPYEHYSPVATCPSYTPLRSPLFPRRSKFASGSRRWTLRRRSIPAAWYDKSLIWFVLLLRFVCEIARGSASVLPARKWLTHWSERSPSSAARTMLSRSEGERFGPHGDLLAQSST
jgi:hypothetical protein